MIGFALCAEKKGQKNHFATTVSLWLFIWRTLLYTGNRKTISNNLLGGKTMNVQEKVVVITGGGSGLGKEAALTFAEHGAHVVVADFNGAAAQEVADMITQQGKKALAIQVDVSNRNEVDAFVAKTLDVFGTIDVLINNAGITMDATLAKMTVDQWNQVLAVNQTGVFHCTQAVIPHMIDKRSGRIINTSSIVGRMGNFGQTNYAATKAAVIAMTQTWAKELGRKGINVNAVAPGFIATPMTEKMPENVLQAMEQKVALQRLGLPTDVANAYLFLASDAANYINGAVLPVDGGLSI